MQTKSKPNTIVYSATRCVHCDTAKSLLTERGIEYEERIIGSAQWNIEDLRVDFPGAKTVPQVIVNGVPVGTLTQLKKFLNDQT